MWSEPVDERAVRVAVAAFAVLAFAATGGRVTWFWIRYRRRPIAPPRNLAERIFQSLLLLAIGLLVVAGLARLSGGPYDSLTGAWRELESRATFGIGSSLAVLGWGIVLLAGQQMRASWRIGIPDERTELVTTGLYSLVRNPIYDGLAVALLGYAALLPSALTFAVFCGFIALIPFWVRFEEKQQLALHGETFRRYCERTGRFVPWLR